MGAASQRHRTEYKELRVNEKLALELMMDMLLYERVPELVPLRAMALQAYSDMQRRSVDGPVDDNLVRKWYGELTEQFFRFVGMLVKAGHIENLKALKDLLRERHRLHVETLIIPCPGVGRVEL